MKDSELHILLALAGIAALLYFGWPEDAAAKDTFVPGGAEWPDNTNTYHGASGSWSMLDQPIL